MLTCPFIILLLFSIIFGCYTDYITENGERHPVCIISLKGEPAISITDAVCDENRNVCKIVKYFDTYSSNKKIYFWKGKIKRMFYVDMNGKTYSCDSEVCKCYDYYCEIKVLSNEIRLYTLDGYFDQIIKVHKSPEYIIRVVENTPKGKLVTIKNYDNNAKMVKEKHSEKIKSEDGYLYKDNEVIWLIRPKSEIHYLTHEEELSDIELVEGEIRLIKKDLGNCRQEIFAVVNGKEYKCSKITAECDGKIINSKVIICCGKLRVTCNLNGNIISSEFSPELQLNWFYLALIVLLVVLLLFYKFFRPLNQA